MHGFARGQLRGGDAVPPTLQAIPDMPDQEINTVMTLALHIDGVRTPPLVGWISKRDQPNSPDEVIVGRGTDAPKSDVPDPAADLTAGEFKSIAAGLLTVFEARVGNKVALRNQSGNKSMHIVLFTLTILLALSANDARATPTEDASTRIEEGMTIEQVRNAIGFRPNVVEEKTCGGNDTIPVWTCRVQTYADGTRTLIVYFRKLDDRPTWVVRSWYVR
jgi:hypothetical protein